MNLQENGEKNRVFFNAKIDEYDDTHEKFMKTKGELAINLPEDTRRILDLGAGTGLELYDVFKKLPDSRVVAVDISEKMLEKLRTREFSDKISIICGNFFNVEFGKDYDAVISTSALHHFLMEDKKTLYKKIYDSLKDGGIFLNSDKIVISDEDEQSCIEYFNENINKMPHIDTPLSINHEVEVLRKVGFEDVSVSETDREDYRLFKAYKRK